MSAWELWTLATALEAGLVGGLLLLALRWVHVPPRWSTALLLVAMLHFLAPPLAHIPHFRPVVALDVAGGAASVEGLLGLLALLQAVGLVFGLGVVFISVLRVRRARDRGTRIEAGRVAEALREVVGDRAHPEIYLTRIQAPLATGLLRPTILMPPEAARLPERGLRMILAHEVAHLRRRDPLAAAIRLLVLSLWWFHPVAWLLAARHRHDSELAADEAVVPSFGSPIEYCDVLLASLAGRTPFTGFAAGLQASSMERRLRRLLRPPRRPHVGRWVLGGLVVLVGLSLPLRFLEPGAPGHDQVRIRTVIPDPIVIRSVR